MPRESSAPVLAAALCREAMEELGAVIAPADLRLASVTDDVQPLFAPHEPIIARYRQGLLYAAG